DASGNCAWKLLKGRGSDGKSNEAGRAAFYFNADGSDLNYSASGAYGISQSYPFFRASETHLLIAEAYARLNSGTIDANAIAELNQARHYANAAFKDTLQDFAAADFATPAALMQMIFNEQYLALMHQIEAWNLLRRIDYAVS